MIEIRKVDKDFKLIAPDGKEFNFWIDWSRIKGEALIPVPSIQEEFSVMVTNCENGLGAKAIMMTINNLTGQLMDIADVSEPPEGVRNRLTAKLVGKKKWVKIPVDHQFFSTIIPDISVKELMDSFNTDVFQYAVKYRKHTETGPAV